MTNLRIEICKNFRGKFDMRIGDLEGCSESCNITKEELLSELSNELDEVFLFDSQEQENKIGSATQDSADKGLKTQSPDNINKKMLQNYRDNIDSISTKEVKPVILDDNESCDCSQFRLLNKSEVNSQEEESLRAFALNYKEAKKKLDALDKNLARENK